MLKLLQIRNLNGFSGNLLSVFLLGATFFLVHSSRAHFPPPDGAFQDRQESVLLEVADQFNPDRNRPFENRVQHGWESVYFLAALEVNRRGLGSGTTVDQSEDWLRSMTETMIDKLEDSGSDTWNSQGSLPFSPTFKYAPLAYGYVLNQYGDELPGDLRENIRYILEDSPLRESPSNTLVNGRIMVLAGQILAGEALGYDSSLWQLGYDRLQAVYDNTMSQGGIEMNSPVYTNYQYPALAVLMKLDHEKARNQARIMLDNQLMVAGHLYLEGGGVGVPRARHRAGAYGGSQTLPQQFQLFFGEPASYDGDRRHSLAAAISDYQPPEIVESFFGDKPDSGYEFWTYTPNPLGGRMPNTIYQLGPDNVQVSPWHAVMAPAGNAKMALAYGHRGFSHHISMGLTVRDANGDFQMFYHHNPMVSGDTYDNGNQILGQPSSDPDDWTHEGYDYERLLWGRTLLSIWDPTLDDKSDNVVRNIQDTRARIPNLANFGGEMIQHEGWYVGRMGETYVAYFPLGEIDLAEPRSGGDWFYIRLNGRSGCIMEMATTDEFDSVRDYAEDLDSRHRTFVNHRGFYVEFDALDPEGGKLKRLRLEYSPERRFIDGKEFSIADYDQGYINSPWIDWSADNRVKTLERSGYPSVVYNIPDAEVLDEGRDDPRALILIGTTTNPGSLGGVRGFLEEHRYNVVVSSEWANRTIGSDEAAEIEEAYDLVIVSSEAPPRQYSSAGWQDLSVPILSLSASMLTQSTWGWGAGATEDAQSDSFDVESPEHFLLESVAVSESDLVVYRNGEASVRGLDETHGNGEVILTQDGRAVFGFWREGEIDDNPAPRIFLNFGYEALLDADNADQQRDFDASNIDALTGDGKRLLLNSADHLARDFSGEDPLSSYEAWKHDNFSETEREDMEISGPLADPGGRGVVNFLRYALVLGRDPVDGQSAGVILGETTVNEIRNERRYLTLTYNRLKNASDVVYTLRGSFDLVNWQSIDDPEVIESTEADGYETITVRDEVAFDENRKRFLCIEVRKN